MEIHKSGNVISVRKVSSDKRPRSFLTHMVSDSHIKYLPMDGQEPISVTPGSLMAQSKPFSDP
jgi:hypothetical protein